MNWKYKRKQILINNTRRLGTSRLHRSLNPSEPFFFVSLRFWLLLRTVSNYNKINSLNLKSFQMDTCATSTQSMFTAGWNLAIPVSLLTEILRIYLSSFCFDFFFLFVLIFLSVCLPSWYVQSVWWTWYTVRLYATVRLNT